MPYIVTTRRPSTLPHGEHPHDYGYPMTVVSRRAVATLEEARGVAMDVSLDADSPRCHRDAMGLPKSGGAVGPLPDGTMIEVEPVEWTELASDDRRSAKWAERGLFGAQNRIIVAYNAAQTTEIEES